MIVIRPAVREDAIWLSSRLRAEDAREVVTSTGRSPHEVLPESFDVSEECFTVRRVVEGKVHPDPVALFGVTSLGVVWFLGSDDVRLCALSIVLEAPAWLNYMSRRHPMGLWNFADSRNSAHIRWCHLTGFTLGEPQTIHGVPFYYIHRPACVTP